MINANQMITVTKKNVMIVGLLTGILSLLSITSFILALTNRAQISHNYQFVATNFNALESKVNVSNTLMENITALEQQIIQSELEQKKITVNYDNLNNRTVRHEHDIVLLQTVVNDKNLDNRLDSIEVSLQNDEIDIDSIKSIQRTQQITLDEMAKSFIDFKSQIIQKITTMLSGSKTTLANSAKKSSNVSVSYISNFNYKLSSIEYRSGEKWAVFSPKKFKFVSELQFLRVGDIIDNWTISQINNQSVKLINGVQIYTLTISE